MCSNCQRAVPNTSLQNHPSTSSESQVKSEILCDFHLTKSHDTPCEQQYTPPRLPPRPVHFMDIFTGEITCYDSLYQAGKAMNIVSSAIALQMSTADNIRLFARRYIVLDKHIDLSIVTQNIIDTLLVRATKGYFIYDDKNDQVSFFPTLPELIRQYTLDDPGYRITYHLKHRLFYRPKPTLFLTKSHLALYRLSEKERHIWFKDKIKFLN